LVDRLVSSRIQRLETVGLEKESNMGILMNAPAQTGAEAPRLWAQLRPYRFADQFHQIRAHRRFVTWEMCELLCRESARLTTSEPDRAVELAELAVLISDLLREEDSAADSRRLYQLRGYAWAHDGNARRVLGDLRNADESFAIAEAWWEAGAAGVGDLLGYEALILDNKASLRIAQRRFPEAFDILDRTFAIHTDGCRPELQDLHLAGRALIKKAMGFIEMGEPAPAIELLQEAEGMVDAGRDPRLFLCLRHNLLCSLVAIEEHAEALGMLPEVEALCREIGNPLDLLRLRWMEGRIALALGRTQAAVEIFQAMRQEFARRGLAYDAALVTLDLTALHARVGAMAEVKALSLEMAGIFQAQDVPREALAALLFFQKAAERERATVKLTREIAAFLQKLRSEPDLRFEQTR
jgi:tetratricopeptide (TPR) repeat protein